MAGFNVRCSRETCKARHVFAKHPDCYARPRKCRICGGTRFRVDVDRQARKSRVQGCTCTGYKWEGVMSGAMHRRGSRFCWYRADGTQRDPGDADFEDPDYVEEVEDATA